MRHYTVPLYLDCGTFEHSGARPWTSPALVGSERLDPKAAMAQSGLVGYGFVGTRNGTSTQRLLLGSIKDVICVKIAFTAWVQRRQAHSFTEEILKFVPQPEKHPETPSQNSPVVTSASTQSVGAGPSVPHQQSADDVIIEIYESQSPEQPEGNNSRGPINR